MWLVFRYFIGILFVFVFIFIFIFIFAFAYLLFALGNSLRACASGPIQTQINCSIGTAGRMCNLYE